MLTAKPDLEGLGARSLLSLAGSGVTSSPVFAGNAPDMIEFFQRSLIRSKSRLFSFRLLAIEEIVRTDGA